MHSGYIGIPKGKKILVILKCYMLVSAFYSQVKYLASGTSVSGLPWLWCFFLCLHFCAFTVAVCVSKLGPNRRKGFCEQQCSEFIVIVESEQAFKDS